MDRLEGIVVADTEDEDMVYVFDFESIDSNGPSMGRLEMGQ